MEQSKETLTVTNETRHSDLEKFCGDSLRSFTGQTFVMTKTGKELIQLGDTMEKDQDGTFTLIKHQ